MFAQRDTKRGQSATKLKELSGTRHRKAVCVSNVTPDHETPWDVVHELRKDVRGLNGLARVRYVNKGREHMRHCGGPFQTP